jgi:hypothetical protein
MRRKGRKGARSARVRQRGSASELPRLRATPGIDAATEVELEHAWNHEHGLGSPSVFKQRKVQGFGAIDKQTSAQPGLVLDDPRAATVSADVEKVCSGGSIGRGRFSIFAHGKLQMQVVRAFRASSRFCARRVVVLKIRSGPERCAALDPSHEASEARLPDQKIPSDVRQLSELARSGVARLKFESVVDEHQSAAAVSFHPLGEANGGPFEDERTPGRTIAIAGDPESGLVTTDRDQRDRLIQDPCVRATQRAAIARCRRCGPTDTDGLARVVVSLSPKLRAGWQSMSHAHGGHRSCILVFVVLRGFLLFCAARSCADTANVPIGAYEFERESGAIS